MGWEYPIMLRRKLYDDKPNRERPDIVVLTEFYPRLGWDYLQNDLGIAGYFLFLNRDPEVKCELIAGHLTIKNTNHPALMDLLPVNRY